MSVDNEPSVANFSIWPWLSKAVSTAFDVRKLVLAVVGIGLHAMGWFVIDMLFGTRSLATIVIPDTGLGGPGSGFRLEKMLTLAGYRVIMSFDVIIRPWIGVFRSEATWGEFAHDAFAGVWCVAVWGVVGGAIGRIAVVQAGTIESVGMVSGLKFAGRRAFALIGAPLAPLLVVAVFTIPGAILGMISRLGSVGETISGALGFVPILASIPIALVLFALAATWPLMHMTIVAEGEDVFDALSRSFSYLNQKAGRYLVLIVLAVCFGFVGEAVLTVIAYVIMNLALWTVSITASAGGAATALGANGPVLALWVKLVELVVLAWSYSYLWSAAAAIYLILRKEVDHTPTHDLYFPSHDQDTFAPSAPGSVGSAITPASISSE